MNGRFPVFLAAILIHCAPLEAAEPRGIRVIDGNKATGSAQAVVVDPTALAHTAQLLPLDSAGRIVGKDDPGAQIEKVLDNLAAALQEARAGLDRAVKVNVYVRRSAVVGEVQKAMGRRFSGAVQPAVTFVEGALPHPDALVAMDAVAAIEANEPGEVKRLRSAALPGAKNTTHVAILPAGPHVYISGQAVKGDDLATSTQKTMESLRETLKFLGLNESQVVHVKGFLKPMASVAEAEKEIVKFFGNQPVPPMAFVEWTMALPIEIELVVAAPRSKDKAAEAIEFLTPPGVQASPVYSRIARINHGKIVYISGLFGKSGNDADAQIREVFDRLGEMLTKTGSDFGHLAKATYYVADEETSRKLNELRPKYYDPRRPPAASKAVVPGVGFVGKTLTLDMIAVAPR
jgi:enamine deaminase RidA (YjgF/YER057c/UK114 family)